MPGDKGYSPIVQLNFVNWLDNATARELKSAEEILNAQRDDKLEITRTDILINTLQYNNNNEGKMSKLANKNGEKVKKT